MKREIKFRGKRVDNGEWVYGYYVFRPDGKHLIYWQPFEEATNNTYHEVIPETVGQFICQDEYGNDVFTGDVCRDILNNDNVFEIAFDDFEYWAKGSTNEDRTLWDLYTRGRIELIGNIHDK